MSVKFNTVYISKDDGEYNNMDEIHLFIERPDKDADCMCLLSISVVKRESLEKMLEAVRCDKTAAVMWDDVDSIYSIFVEQKKVIFQIDVKYHGGLYPTRFDFPKESCIGLFETILECV